MFSKILFLVKPEIFEYIPSVCSAKSGKTGKIVFSGELLSLLGAGF